jgi:hypothetical protein
MDRMKHLLALAASAAVQQACGGAASDAKPGYMVVDMLPAPTRCVGVPEGVHATAEWTRAKDGAPARVVIKAMADAGVRFSSQRPTADGVEMTRVDASSTELTIELKLPSDRPGAWIVWVGVECSNGPGTVTLDVLLDASTGKARVSVERAPSN